MAVFHIVIREDFFVYLLIHIDCCKPYSTPICRYTKTILKYCIEEFSDSIRIFKYLRKGILPLDCLPFIPKSCDCGTAF